MDKFVLRMPDGSGYLVKPGTCYHVQVEDHSITFIGNANWPTDGRFLIPVNVPDGMDQAKLDEIASKIESQFC